jgi:hypothetical protein
MGEEALQSGRGDRVFDRDGIEALPCGGDRLRINVGGEDLQLGRAPDRAEAL